MHPPYKAFYQGHPEMNWHIFFTSCSKNPHGLKSLITRISLPLNPENLRPHSTSSNENATPL